MAKLYIVPTPIGNLDDITLRAVNVLREVDFILAEDTRTTSFLLRTPRYREKTPFAPQVQRTRHGQDGGRVDCRRTQCRVGFGRRDTRYLRPGFLLVRTCVEAGIEVETLPGATALIPALVQSGFPCDRFCFEGFLPQKKGRTKQLQALADEERTMIFYESPYRVVKCLEQFAEVFGPGRRGVRIARTDQEVRADRAGHCRRGAGAFPHDRTQRRIRDRAGRKTQARTGNAGGRRRTKDRI